MTLDSKFSCPIFINRDAHITASFHSFCGSVVYSSVTFRDLMDFCTPVPSIDHCHQTPLKIHIHRHSITAYTSQILSSSSFQFSSVILLQRFICFHKISIIYNATYNVQFFWFILD